MCFVLDDAYIGAFDINFNDVMYCLDGAGVTDGYINYYKPFIYGGDSNGLYLIYSQFWQWGDGFVDHLALCEIEIKSTDTHRDMNKYLL